MRIEKVELNKIKVTVFPFDLHNMNMNIGSLKPDSPQLHSFLYKVMEKVKKETGFNPYSGQIVVEASPVGECIILTVTKIINKDNQQPKKVRPSKITAVSKKKTSNKHLYYFFDFEDFCKAITNLSESTIQSSTYYQLKDCHVLLVTSQAENEHILLCEFASQHIHQNNLAESFICEHSLKIISSDELVKMSKGICDLYK